MSAITCSPAGAGGVERLPQPNKIGHLEKLKQQRRTTLRGKHPALGAVILSDVSNAQEATSSSSAFVIGAHHSPGGDSPVSNPRSLHLEEADARIEKQAKVIHQPMHHFDTSREPSSRLEPQDHRASLSEKLRAAREATVLLPEPAATLNRKLKQTIAQIAFHEGNIAKYTPPVKPTRAFTPDKPWLPANGSYKGSKHKDASTADRKLAPRPPVQAAAVREESEKQLKLLTTLKARLRMKLTLAIMRQAAQEAQLRERLLFNVRLSETKKLAGQLLQQWRQTAVPSEEAVSRIHQHRRKIDLQQARVVLQQWRQTAESNALIATQLAQAQLLRRRRLLTAALAHWKIFVKIEQALIMQSTLVSRWTGTWTARKAFTHWRLQTRRSSLQQQAFETAIGCTDGIDSEENGLPSIEKDAINTIKEALEATALSLKPLAAVVSETYAAVVLSTQEAGLRWTYWPDGDDTVLHEPVQASSPLPDLYDPASYSSPVKKQRTGRCNSELEALEEEIVCVEKAAEDIGNKLQVVKKDKRLIQMQLKAVDGALYDIDGRRSSLEHRKTAVDEAEAMVDTGIEQAKQRIEAIELECEQARTVYNCASEEMQQAIGQTTNAQAALDECVARQASCSSGISSWASKIESATRELARAPRTQQAVASAKLREAQQRLATDRATAQELQKSYPLLKQRLEEAQQALDEATNRRDDASQALKRLESNLETAQSKLESLLAAKAKCSRERAAIQASMSQSAADYESNKVHQDALRQQLDEINAQRTRLYHQGQLLKDRHKDLECVYNRLMESSLQAAMWKPDCILDNNTGPLCLEESTSPVKRQLQLEDDNDTQSLAVIAVDADAISNEGDPLSVRYDFESAADEYYVQHLQKRVIHIMQKAAQQARLLNAAADALASLKLLPDIVTAWRSTAANIKEWVGDTSDILRLKYSFIAWARHTREEVSLRRRLESATDRRERALARAIVQSWKIVAIREKWRDEVHTTIVSNRMRNMLHFWKSWASVKAAEKHNEQLATAAHLERRMAQAWYYWLDQHRATMLLRRVFGRAIDSWSEHVGPRGHANAFKLQLRAFHAWQLAAILQQEERREAAIEGAADMMRARRLLSCAFTALKENATLLEQLPASSVVALENRSLALLKTYFVAWRDTSRQQSEKLTEYWLKWQVNAKLHNALLLWRAVTIRMNGTIQQQQQMSINSNDDGPEKKSQRPASSAAASSDTVSRRQQLKLRCNPRLSRALVNNTTVLVRGESANWSAAADRWRNQREVYSREISNSVQ